MSGLLEELRRRKVTRTALAYAVAAWVVWQVVDVITPALGWSDRVLTFVVVGAIALAPVVLALSWLLELRLEPDRSDAKTPSASERPPSSARPLARRSALVISLPALALSGVLALLLWPTTGAAVPDFEAGDPTLISQCENDTDDPDLGKVLNTALDAAIRQSRYVELTSMEASRSFAVRYLQREPSVTIDADVANEIAIRGGFKVAIHCAIRPIGEGYQIVARMTDPHGPTDLRVITRQARDAGELFTVIDAVASDLRSGLGESLSSIRADRPLAKVTTASLEALRSYTLALEAERVGDRAQARLHMLAALERDSLFARAHSALGNWAYWNGSLPEGERHYRNALRDPERLAERDRLWIQASWASSRGDYPQSIALYNTYVDRWPGEAAAWYNLGTQHFRAQQCDQAGAAFARVLALDSAHASAHINMASCLATVGQRDSAVVHYRLAFELQPAWRHITNLNHEYGFVLVALGRLDEARALFEEQLTGSVEQQAAGQRSLALLHMFQGQYRAAVPLLREAIRQRGALGHGLSELRDRMYLVGVLDVLGQQSAVRAELARADEIGNRIYASPSWLAYLAEHHLRSGDRPGVAALLERAAADTLAVSSTDQAIRHQMRALLGLLDGDTSGASEEARSASDLFPGTRTQRWTCPIALVQDEWDVARDQCGKLADGNGLGWEGQEAQLLSLFWLGRLEEQSGNEARALELYRRLQSTWVDADEGIRFRDVDGSRVDVLAEVEAGAARLTADSPTS